MTAQDRSDHDVYRVRWREGLRTIVFLYRHPEDTTQIARVIEALQGCSVPRLLERMRRRPRGEALLRQKPSLRQALADRQWLESLPEGSLGRAYIDYCRAEGLSAAMTTYVDNGTTPERWARLSDDEAFIQDFLFHSHDIYHLVSGYRTDLVGEVCLLAFSTAQLRNTGVAAMALLGLYSLRLPRLRGQRLAARAFVRGMRGAWLPEQDWVARMGEPLEAIQKELGLYPPPIYESLRVGLAKKKSRSVERSVMGPTDSPGSSGMNGAGTP